MQTDQKARRSPVSTIRDKDILYCLFGIRLVTTWVPTGYHWHANGLPKISKVRIDEDKILTPMS